MRRPDLGNRRSVGTFATSVIITFGVIQMLEPGLIKTAHSFKRVRAPNGQEGAPVSDANAMNRCMYSVALVGDHNPCWIDCFKALPIFLCSIFWNISP